MGGCLAVNWSLTIHKQLSQFPKSGKTISCLGVLTSDMYTTTST